jgi:hypothetical protein
VAGRRRPAFEPTDDQRKNVEIVAGLGMPEAQICALIRDNKDTPIAVTMLRKHFAKELEQGAAKLNAKMGNFAIATILGAPIPEGSGVTPITDEHARARLIQIYIRSRMGWTETVVDQRKARGGPIIVQIAKGDENL